MVTSSTELSSTQVPCKICGLSSAPFGQLQVLRKYPVQYFRCGNCNFIQTEFPYWLDEAYSTAISRLDVGIMQRNVVNCEVTCAILNQFFPMATRMVDFGAGHGAFVRMMRDRGFNFFWSDLHASNDYARGFEHVEGATYNLLTAFEVLEHLVDPVAEFARLSDLADNIFVSTSLVPEPAPALSDWWYYGPLSGQHVSLFTPKALQTLATRFGRSLVSYGSYHLFTKKPVSRLRYQIATRYRIARVVNSFYRRPGLIESDEEWMSKQIS